jgi:uncharacterized protein YdhG (YjbR/CyaY superfamily)
VSETRKSAKSRTPTPETFSSEERAAMKERSREVRTSTRRGNAKAAAADQEAEALAKIAEMPESDRLMAERIHAVATAAGLSPRTWYGMPAYAKDGKVVCFFQPALKFKTRYATLGFSDEAQLDDGTMWANAFALTAVTAADEKKIRALVEKALG